MAKFKGMPSGGMGNMANMMRQAQKMQQEMMKVQEELDNYSVEASAGGGAITVIANGKKEITSMKINPDIVNADDVEMLEDLITTAVNEAVRKADEMATEKMNKATGGMTVPGIF